MAREIEKDMAIKVCSDLTGANEFEGQETVILLSKMSTILMGYLKPINSFLCIITET